VTATLPQCPACGARHATANRFNGCCCWPCADRMAESRNRADRHNPGEGKGTSQPPSVHVRPDPASSGQARAPNRRSAKRGRTAKRNALVERVTGQRQFFEAATELELSAGAIAVWCWLWTCTRNGQAKYTVRRLAERFGVVPSTVSRWVGELTNAGFVETVRRGKPGRSATIVRVRHSPDTTPDRRPR
jgi:DNA-binding transcriptional ArsR family regulator